MCLYVDAEEHELGDLGEPANYKAALLDPESNKWLDAMNVEMQSMKDNEVWDLVDLPLNGKIVGSKWLFKKKNDMDGVVYTFKSRLVAKGFTQTYGVDYEETFSPVADIRAIRILMAIAAFYDSEIWKMDVKTALLNGHLSEEVYMVQPEEHNKPISTESRRTTLTTVKNILKYLRNNKDMFLVYGGDLKRELRVSCYTDVGYLMDADDLKYQTEYVFILNGGVVEWKSTKQSIFATSSTEAEYIAAYDASKEVVWVRKFISGLGIVPTIEEPIKMYCDNTGAIAIAKESGITKGARHYRAKVHYLQEVIEFGDVKIEKVHTDENLADPFTKALPYPKHSELTKNIGLILASSLM
ncbi:putative retrotransposon protein [Tanacetum coccineum]